MAEEDKKDNKINDSGAIETPKKRERVKKIKESDFKKAEESLKKELDRRKYSQYRKNAELIWKNVDRQVAMKPMDFDETSTEEEWLNMFETGELAIASEMMTGDLLRAIFPDQRNWFEAHIEAPVNLDPNTGENVPLPKKLQDMADGRLRALITQQHVDFSLRDRVELSLKEALHHGMFVAEVKEQCMTMVSGNKIKDIYSPVWIPHSMWNCWPDPSPSLVGENMFYGGSMFIRSYMPLHKLMEMATGEGWIKGALKKIPKRENEVKEDKTRDIEIITYWGDVTIPVASDGMSASENDMFFPNHKVIMANGKMVYLEENDTPYPPIICKGYEKMDVRDIYAFSPIIKQSPIQDLTSILTNEYVNGIQLHVRPPIVYDGNDPEFIENGGPNISPGAKTASKGGSKFEQLKIGDPATALSGVQFLMEKMKSALGRPGIQVGDRASATEVMTKQADSEAGPFAFALKVDAGLRAFLFMQHHLNFIRKDFTYNYYNQEMDSPDFLVAKHKDLPESVNFEVVGSRGVLGQAKRQAAFTQVNSFLLGHPAMAGMLEVGEIVKQMYMDSGVKNPERFLKQSDGIPPEVKQQMEQMKQMIGQLQGQLKDSETQNQVKLQIAEKNHEAKMAKIQSQHANDVAKVHLEADKLNSAHTIATGKQALDLREEKMNRIIDKFEHVIKITSEKHKKIDKEEKGLMGAEIESPQEDSTETKEE